MTTEQVQWFFTEVAPYASLFAIMAGLLVECWRRCASKRGDNDD